MLICSYITVSLYFYIAVWLYCYITVIWCDCVGNVL